MDLREDITVEPESKVYPHNKNEASAFLRDVAKCHIKRGVAETYPFRLKDHEYRPPSPEPTELEYNDFKLECGELLTRFGDFAFKDSTTHETEEYIELMMEAFVAKVTYRAEQSLRR